MSGVEELGSGSRGGRGGGSASRGGSRGGALRGASRGAMRGGRSGGRGGAHVASSDAADAAADADSSSTTNNGETTATRAPRKGPPRPRPLSPIDEPDHEQHKKVAAEHNARLKDINTKIDALTKRIEEHARQRKTQREEIKTQQAKLDALQQQKQAAFESYQTLRVQIETTTVSQVALKKELQETQSRLAFPTLAACDAHIKALERQLSTSKNLPVSAERKLIEDIRTSKANRVIVYEFERRSAEIKSDAELERMQKLCDAEYERGYAVKSQEEAQAPLVEAAKAAEKKLLAQMDVWVGERRVLLDQRADLEREFAYVCDQFKQQQSAYATYAQRRDEVAAWDAKRDQERREYEARKKRREMWERRRAEREAEEAAYQDELERQELERDPHDHEKYVVDELISYVTKLMPGQQAQSVDGVNADRAALAAQARKIAEERNAQFKGQQGVPLQRKKKDDIASLFGPASTPSSKAKKSEKSDAAAATTTATEKKPASKVLTHVANVFQWFNIVKVSAPVLSTDLEQTLAQLKERREFFHQDSETILVERRAKYEEKMRLRELEQEIVEVEEVQDVEVEGEVAAEGEVEEAQ